MPTGEASMYLGLHAWRTDIAHVSNKCESEYFCGNFDTRACNAFWTSAKNGVSLYSCSTILQCGDDDG